MSITLERAETGTGGLGPRQEPPERLDATTDANSTRATRDRRPGGRRSLVPLWTGRALQMVSATMALIALSNALLPEGVYWAASYFAVFGLSPEPFLFNAVLLFIAGAAAKRRLRGSLVFLVIFEIPTLLSPIPGLVSALFTGSDPLADGAGIDLLASALAGCLILLLISARREFSARGETASYLGALTTLVGGVALAVTVGGLLAQRFPTGQGSTADAWWRSLHAATGVYPSDWAVEGTAGGLQTWIEVVVSSTSALALLTALVLLLKNARARRVLTESEELRLRNLIEDTPSEDSLAYFATRRDKSIYFSENGRAAVSYRVVGRVALASGDPIGPEAEWDGVVAEWLHAVEGHGWLTAALAVTERGAQAYDRQGLRGMVLGDEAVIQVDGPRAAAVLRSPQVAAARRRLRRAGHTIQLRRQTAVSPEELTHLATLANTWRRSGEERGFSMALSRMADPVDDRSLIATVHDEDGHVTALLVFVPWNRDGLSLDLMRRSPDAVNGATEALVAEIIAEGEGLGVRRLSLNFAVFRDVFVRGARIGAGPILRIKRKALLIFARRWQLDSLRTANEKYDPNWRPRLVMWARGASLADVMIAVARAEGFAAMFPSGGSVVTTPRSDDFVQTFRTRQAEKRSGTLHADLRGSSSPRAQRAAALRQVGIDPYPASVPRTIRIADLRFDEPGDEPVSVTGRVVARRRHGGIVFLDLREEHSRVQVIATMDATLEYSQLVQSNLGDLLSVTGTPGRSRSGEASIHAQTWTLAAKSLRQPPNARTGLRDPEAQVRLRHVHLATDPDAARLLLARSHAVRALRDGLLDESYLEVETPILQRTHGGANARPFRTYINAYDRDLSLRIAPELALKRLIVAGFPQIFEIGRNFRNEGVDSTHNPEFTAMEAYRAYADYHDMRRLAEKLIKRMASAISGAPTLRDSAGVSFDVSHPWRVVSVCDALTEKIGAQVTIGMPLVGLLDLCKVYDVGVEGTETAGMLIERLYEELVEPETQLPTFYIDFPSDTSPLARPHRSVPGLSERWDLVAFGMELGTAYTELTDPLEQRRRLTAQSLRAANGDQEAMEIDEEFLEALEYGMPPTGGLGLGVDRIVMAATGASIRQTLAFPFVR